MGGACSTYGERKGMYRVSVGKPEGKKSLGRSGRRKDEMGCEGYELDRTGLGYGQVAETYECGNEHSGSIKCGKFLD
jgi:hypothetical protein